MTIIQAVRDWVATCPLLEGGQVHVDFLDQIRTPPATVLM